MSFLKDLLGGGHHGGRRRSGGGHHDKHSRRFEEDYGDGPRNERPAGGSPGEGMFCQKCGVANAKDASFCQAAEQPLQPQRTVARNAAMRLPRTLLFATNAVRNNSVR